MLYDALTNPPKPPRMKRIMPSAAPLNVGSFHGSALTVPMKPRFPCLIAKSSNEAKIANAVMNDGIATPYVVTVCSIFQTDEIPGSMNSWWMPTGVESRMSITNVRRVSASLKTFPP